MKSPEEDTEYLPREPIHFAPRAVAVIQIFTRLDEWDDLWMTDVPGYQNNSYQQYERAAKQFLSQLKQEYCCAFLEALKKEIQHELETNFSKAMTHDNS